MLEVMSPEEALRLFAQSYGRPDTLDLTRTERAAAEKIVKALGYHTLAIKLEGANAAELALDLGVIAGELEARPDRGLDLEDGETPAAVQRAFARSVEALPDDARRLFSSLAAFATAEFGRDAALALAAGLQPPATENDLNLLVRRALLEASLNQQMPEASDRQRLRLHPLLRAYAGRGFATLPAAGRDAAASALAVYYAGYTNEVADVALVPDEENITGALEWAHARDEQSLVMRLCDGMRQYWRDRSKNRERRAYLPWGIAAAEAIVTATSPNGERLLLARLYSAYGEVQLLSGRTAEATSLMERSLGIRRDAGDQRGEGIVLSLLGDILRQRGDLAGAQANYERVLAIMREVGDTRGEGVALSLLGDILRQRGDLAGAQANYERVLAIMREIGDTREEGVALFKRGQVDEALGRDAEAEAHYQEGLTRLRTVDEVGQVAVASEVLGAFLITKRGKQSEGCAMLSDAARLYDQMGLADQAEAARETARRLGCP
jgi:tetratricopeptide (TPR) repeat protein